MEGVIFPRYLKYKRKVLFPVQIFSHLKCERKDPCNDFHKIVHYTSFAFEMSVFAENELGQQR